MQLKHAVLAFETEAKPLDALAMCQLLLDQSDASMEVIDKAFLNGSEDADEDVDALQKLLSTDPKTTSQP